MCGVRFGGDETATPQEQQYKIFFKVTDIPDSVEFEEYCDIDFDENKNFLSKTNHLENKNHDT